LLSTEEKLQDIPKKILVFCYSGRKELEYICTIWEEWYFGTFFWLL